MITKVITNGHSRPLLTWQELPTRIQDCYDAVCYKVPEFVEYMGNYFAMSELVTVTFETQYHGWDAFMVLGDFTVMLLKDDPIDCDRVIMGRTN